MLSSWDRSALTAAFGSRWAGGSVEALAAADPCSWKADLLCPVTCGCPSLSCGRAAAGSLGVPAAAALPAQQRWSRAPGPRARASARCFWQLLDGWLSRNARLWFTVKGEGELLLFGERGGVSGHQRPGKILAAAQHHRFLPHFLLSRRSVLLTWERWL